MGLFDRLFGRKPNGTGERRVIQAGPLPSRYDIPQPRLGIFNLIGDAATDIRSADIASFGSCFTSVIDVAGHPPPCDVLLVYAKVGADGEVEGTTSGLREIIRDSGAVIVLVASENPPESYMAAAPRKPYGQANLVMTIERNGSSFSTFFGKLFRLMRQGKTMPVAWNELAPQIPGLEHQDCPGTIFACECGQIGFKQ